MTRRKITPHLMPVGLTGIPRADRAIKRTIDKLRVVQFKQDPLFGAAESFRLSLRNSAIKREGPIQEAAIQDAVEQHSHLRLLQVDRRLKRVPDVQFEIRDNGWIVALEVKRGADHDSTKLRQFRADLIDIPPLLKTALPLFPAECIRFHIVFLDGEPRLSEGLTPDDLGKLYGLHVRSHLMTARQRYSGQVQAILRERGL